MIYKYGNFTQNQISEIKSLIHKKIFFLLLTLDPEEELHYKKVDANKTFDNLLQLIGGLNSVLGCPVEIVEVVALLEAAKIEYNSPTYYEIDFRHSPCRKLILDAGAKTKLIKEV